MHSGIMHDMKHEPCTEQIVVRVPPALRDEIETAAAAEGRSMGNMARRVLERWAADRGTQRQGEMAA
jgi:predicted HicB family RNase H-like nuclease